MSNQIVYVPARTTQAYRVFGDLFTFLVTGEETDGRYATLEVLVAPNNGPGPHTHAAEEETFYVLQGELTFSVGEQTFQASRGDFVHIPRGTVHAIKNGNTPAKLLATFTPAGPERAFLELGEPVEDQLPDPWTEE
jgi:quercetin dioxygenase-like cupin family protein